MKHNSKRFLALFIAASMTLTPVPGVYAEENNGAGQEVIQETGTVESSQEDQTQNHPEDENSGAGETVTADASENNNTVNTNTTAEQEKEPSGNSENQLANQTEQEGGSKDSAENTDSEEEAKKQEALAKLPVVTAEAGAFKEGVYQPDETSVGGSKRTSITCENITVKNGKATARIVFSSAGYPKVWVNVEGNVQEYERRADSTEGTSAFDIPVDLNKEMAIVGYVEKMGAYTQYSLNVKLSAEKEPTGPIPSEPSNPSNPSNPGTTEPSKPGTTDPDTPAPSDPEKPEEGKTLTDGSYRVEVTSSSSMFKVTDCVLTSEKGKMYAVITLSGTGYDKLYMGTAEQAKNAVDADCISYSVNAQGAYTYKIPVESLDKEIAVAAHSIRKDQWYDRTLTFSSASATRIIADGTYEVSAEAGGKMIRVVGCVMQVQNGQMTASVTLSGQGYNRLYLGSVEDAPNDEAHWILPENLLAEQYTFKVPVKELDKTMDIAVHTTKSNKWDSRTLTFHSEGMKKISDHAGNGNGSENGSGTLNLGSSGNGSGTFHPGSENTGTSGSNGSGNTASGSNGSNGTVNVAPNNGKPDAVSRSEADLNKATVQVNSSTGLKDGVYTPDSFSWSGGTGKVTISCNKVTVTGGQAYATLVFSSQHYQYVKANGNTYYPSEKGARSTTFVIPVALNKNNTIIGMTTAMSTPHEIQYSIFVYLAAASAGGKEGAVGKNVTVIGAGNTAGGSKAKASSVSKKLDEEAPQIIGLEYQSETKVEHAKYFKIYHYDQGITLLEIDLNQGTGRSEVSEEGSDAKKVTEKASKSTKASKKKSTKKSKKKATKKSKKKSKKNTKASAKRTTKKKTVKKKTTDKKTAVSTSNGLNPAEQEQADMYQENVVRYLIVPENAEIPAGLDKEVIVIRPDSKSIYAGTNHVLSVLDSLSQTNRITAVGMKAKKCKNDSVKEKMKQKEVIYAGTSGKLNYKKLVKTQSDLAILSSGILPKEGSSKKAAAKKMKNYKNITEKMTLLKVPVIVDRSKDENGKQAKQEWEKVYRVLLGCEE